MRASLLFTYIVLLNSFTVYKALFWMWTHLSHSTILLEGRIKMSEDPRMKMRTDLEALVWKIGKFLPLVVTMKWWASIPFPIKFQRRNQRNSCLSLGKANKEGQIWTRVNKPEWDHVIVKSNWMPGDPGCLSVTFWWVGGKAVKPAHPGSFIY